MEVPEMLNEIAKATDGKITEVGILPDNSGFAMLSMPLRKDHWIYGDRTMERKVCDGPEGEVFSEPPPMVLRIGTAERLSPETLFALNKFPQILTKQILAEAIRKAGKYAVRAATMKGADIDFDPDALLQNLVVGFLGYWTEDGLSSTDEWTNPEK